MLYVAATETIDVVCILTQDAVIVCEVIFTVIGFMLSQIRTLQKLSWLSNLAIWLNVIVIIMTMVVVHYYPPNYAAAASSDIDTSQPIMTSAGLPPGKTVRDNINGLMNCVFAYGGATLFNELMAEMRRPMDFWKGVRTLNSDFLRSETQLTDVRVV